MIENRRDNYSFIFFFSVLLSDRLISIRVWQCLSKTAYLVDPVRAKASYVSSLALTFIKMYKSNQLVGAAVSVSSFVSGESAARHL